MNLKKKTSARILVVEDEPNVAEVMRARLESFGHEVCHIASSDMEAIQAAESLVPDIVIMDIKIEGKLDGIDSARQIQSRIEVPIIYLTSYSDDQLLRRAQATEPFGYLVKPYEASQLKITVEMALFKHRLERERQKLVMDLKDALAKVKMLSGLLPICSCCKKIRDDKGYWNQLEAYIQTHSEAEFTHGICPECVRKLYPNLISRHIGDGPK